MINDFFKMFSSTILYFYVHPLPFIFLLTQKGLLTQKLLQIKRYELVPSMVMMHSVHNRTHFPMTVVQHCHNNLHQKLLQEAQFLSAMYKYNIILSAAKSSLQVTTLPQRQSEIKKGQVSILACIPDKHMHKMFYFKLVICH